MDTELGRVPARTLLDGHADPTRPRVDPPRPSRRRWSWRVLYRPRVVLALILPLRILAVVGLTAMVAFIVQERGDVSGLVWLRSGVLALLAWTVFDQLRSLARSSRRERTSLRTGDPAPFLAAVPAQRLVAARRDGAIRGGVVGIRHGRGAVSALSWWALVAAVVGICVVAAALVTMWMVEDQRTGDPGPWLVGQILLLVGSGFAIGWTLWLAARSVADVRSRRRRPLVQRFLNWLVRLLSLNRTSAATSVVSSPGATATAGGGTTGSSAVLALGSRTALARVSAVLRDASRGANPAADAPSLRPLTTHRVVATALVATASMVVSAAAFAGTAESHQEQASVVAGPASSAVVEALPRAESRTGSGGSQIPDAAVGPDRSLASNAALAATPNAPDANGSPPPPDGPAATATPDVLTAPPVPPPASTTTTTTAPSTTTTTTTAPPTTTTTTIPPSTTTTTTTAPSTTTTTEPPSSGCGPRGNPDSDCDGVSDTDEVGYGSDPDNRASTPEGRTWDTLIGSETCADRVDNDLDGRADSADPGCTG